MKSWSKQFIVLVVIALGLMSVVPALVSASRSVLYYQDGSWIKKVALTPKHRPARVVDTNTGALAIALDGHRLFWITSGSGAHEFESRIMTSTTKGKGVHKLVSGLPLAFSMAASGGYVYWPEEDSIGRVAVDGSHLNRDFIPLPQENGGGVADGLAIEGGYIFFSRCQDGTVGRASLDGRTIEQHLVSMGWPNCPQSLATTGGRVYWSELGGIGGSIGRIGSAKLDGSDIEENSLIAHTTEGPFGIAAGDGALFWSWGGSAGSPEYIGRGTLDGGRVNSKFVSGDSAMALAVGSRRHGGK